MRIVDPPKRFMHTSAHFVLTWVVAWLAYKFLNGQTFGTSRSFDKFAEIMSEHHWGLIMLFFAIIGGSTLFVSSWRTRAFVAFLLSALHTTVAIIFKLGGSKSGTAPGVYFGFAILGLLLAYSTAHTGIRSTAGMDAPDIP